MLKNILKSLSFATVFVLWLLFTCCSAEEKLPTQKLYPPYPDVWGYNVSDFPAMKAGDAGVEAYRMPDGDIWFIIGYSIKYKDPIKGSLYGYAEQKYVLLKFFKGEQIPLSYDQRLSLELREYSTSPLEKKVEFSDGTTIEGGGDYGGKLCFSPDSLYNYLIKKEANNNAKEYLILGVYPYVDVRRNSNACDYKGMPFFYQRLYLLDSSIKLEDDTFIAYSSDSNLILRFDKDFNTKFKAINPVGSHSGNIVPRNFFVIERAVLGELKSKVFKDEMPFNQGMHDELLSYLGDKYNNEK